MKGRVTDLSHGVRNRQPQQRPAVPEGLRPDQCFSVRDADVQQLLHRTARLCPADALNGIRTEHQLHFGMLGYSLFDGRLQSIELHAAKKDFRRAEFADDFVVGWVE